jgi:hypothetical protein
VAVEKLFSGNFNDETRSQVIEFSFALDAEIHENYCFGSFFNTHACLHQSSATAAPIAAITCFWRRCRQPSSRGKMPRLRGRNAQDSKSTAAISRRKQCAR